MDLLKWKRQSSAQSLQGLVAFGPPSSPSLTESSPASSIHEGNNSDYNTNRNSGFFTSVKRSLSRASISPRSGLATTDAPTTPGAPGSPGRKVLHKQTGSFSSFDSKERRSSLTLDSKRRLSRAYSLTMSATSRANTMATGIDFKTAIDWKTQKVEAHCSIEADPQVLRSKPSYLVVTQDYIVKMRSRAEAFTTFTQISGKENDSMVPPPEPVLVIPVHMIISVFLAESSRPSFGIEIWWRSNTCRTAYCSTQIYFGMAQERFEQMSTIISQLKAKNVEFPEASLVPLEVESQIMKIFADEEPEFKTCKPEIFPVVKRTSVKEDVYSNKLEKGKKSQEGSSWYLAVGRNLCYLAEVAPGLPVDLKYQTFGLVTLEAFRANWNYHEERFVLSFREPFKPAATLELASRYYRQIVITFMKADRFLKPCWPTTLQTLEVFRIAGLADPQLLIAGDNYGGLRRTMDAFASAYHCSPVDWEVNWKTPLSPEFRLLPPKTGNTYTNLQLLAVMRSLRYNGYFNSISFANVDLTRLWEKTDSDGRTPVAYMNKSCLALGKVELGNVEAGSLLHQELHALAFCSETIRQINLTNCFTEKSLRRHSSTAGSGHGFLYPILNLLEQGLTKCNRLLLSGNYLRSADIAALIEALMMQTVEIQALDISDCALSDLALRDIFEVLFHQGHSLQYLDVSGNRGRVHASLISNLAQVILDLRKLNVSGIVMGDVQGPIIAFETLSRFEHLEELDMTQFKVNDATLNALEKFLAQKPLPSEPKRYSRSDFYFDPSSTLRKIGLSNCGINGRDAARLFRALSNHTSAHLYISGNPLEDGIEDFCRAISQTSGPTGLHMDMVEFRHEANFVALMKALASNKNIKFLSMVGTAPSPLADEPCGPEVCEALEGFFAENKSVKYLDLSGYSGKLDEGQLGRGFARSLRGLACNNTLTHLRIRNQNLHDDVGTVGSGIKGNNTLRMVDCQDNCWNLTSIQFLAQSLKLNTSIVEFPFTQREFDRAWTGIRRQSGIHQGHDGMLRSALQRQVQDIQATIARNRAAVVANSPFAIDFEESSETGDRLGWPSLELKMVNPNSGGSSSKSHQPSSAPIQRPLSTISNPKLRLQSSSPSRLLDLDLDSDLLNTPVDPPEVTRRIHEVATAVAMPMTLYSDVTEMSIDATSPYDITGRELPLLETPPGALSPNNDGGDGTSSSSPTTPEMPVTPPLSAESEDASDDGAHKESGRIVHGVDMGPYFAGSGRDFVVGRFRIGGLESHVEE